MEGGVKRFPCSGARHDRPRWLSHDLSASTLSASVNRASTSQLNAGIFSNGDNILVSQTSYRKVTETDARNWVHENKAALDRARLESPHPLVQQLNRALTKKSEELWDSGCWIQHKFREHGASDQQIYDAQFACGQRALFGDAFETAVAYVNEFIATRQLAETPGNELAQKICNEVLGPFEQSEVSP